MTQAGCSLIAYNEFNRDAIDTHNLNLPNCPLIEYNGITDIKKIPDNVFVQYKGQIDIVFAGFPCQGFSHAGKKKEDDPRNELVYEFVRVVQLIQPEWIIGENVRGLLSRQGLEPKTGKKQPVINIINELFEGIGYKLTWEIHDATQYGVPQLRKRLIIIGHRGKDYPHIDFKHNSETLPNCSIRSILETNLEGAVEFPIQNIPADLDNNFWISTEITAPSGNPHPNLVRLVQGIRNKSSKELAAENGTTTEKTVIVPGGLVSFGRRIGGYHGEVLHPDRPCKTIICNYELCPRLFVGLKSANGKYYVRVLNTRELAQIQGFPLEYQFSGQTKSIIKQIGNAVPPPMIKKIVESLETTTFDQHPQHSLANSQTDLANDFEDDEDD
jgi:DNA (cytosine-5)-methyltransferase 1